MNTTLTEQRRQLVESFKDKEYRDAFVASRLATGIAFKMRETRKSRPLTQAQLAALSGTKQSVISRFEQRNYGNYSIGSLRKIFAALDVALIVDAIPFSEFIDRLLMLSPEDLVIPKFDDDPGIQAPKFGLTTASASWFDTQKVLASIPTLAFTGVFPALTTATLMTTAAPDQATGRVPRDSSQPAIATVDRQEKEPALAA